MSSQKINEIKKKRENERFRKKKSQIPYAIITTIIGILFYIYLLKNNNYNSIFWIIGIATGFVLQRTRLCFTAGFRDPFMVGSTTVFRGVLIGIIISSFGFLIIQYNYININGINAHSNIPGIIAPVGIHTIVGAILFGIGMVIAGGCGSGVLMRIGEGFIVQIVVLIGFIIGSLLGAYQYRFWHENFISKSPTIYFPEHLGFEVAATVQAIVLIILYIISYIYDKKNNIMIT